MVEAGPLWLLSLSLPGQWPVRSQLVFGGRTKQPPAPSSPTACHAAKLAATDTSCSTPCEVPLAQLGRHAPSRPERSAGPSTNQASP